VRFVTSWLAAGLCVCLSPALAGAVSLGNNRPLITLSLARGEAVQGSIEVVNNGESPISVKAYLADWRYSDAGDGTKEFVPPATLPRSCAEWISFLPQTLEIPAHGKAVVDYTVRVPGDETLEGGYYAVLFFESIIGELPDVQQDGAVVRFAARIGSLFDIEIQQTARREGRLTLRPLAAPDASGPFALEAVLANEGNTTLQCENTFHVMGTDGVVVGRGQLPKGYLSPGQRVPLSGFWQEPLSAGAYSVVVTADCGETLVLVEEQALTVP